MFNNTFQIQRNFVKISIAFLVAVLVGCNFETTQTPTQIQNNSNVSSEIILTKEIEEAQKTVSSFFDLSFKKNMSEALKLEASKKDTPPTPFEDDGITPKIPSTVSAKKGGIDAAFYFIYLSHSDNFGILYSQELIEAGEAIVLATIRHHKDDRKFDSYIRFYLVKQNDEWKILQIDYDPLTVKPKPKDTAPSFPVISS